MSNPRPSADQAQATPEGVARPEPRGYPGNLGLLFAGHAREDRPAIVDLHDARHHAAI